jgi:hemolysin activation/secretion protein
VSCPKSAVSLALLVSLGLPATALAQPSGTVERLYQDQQLRDQLDNQRNQQSQPSQPLIEGDPSSQPRQPTEEKGTPTGPPIRGVELEGANLFPTDELDRLRQKWVGQPGDPAALTAIQAAVTDYYEQAKLLALAGKPRLGLDGIVLIPVVEARLGAVTVNNNSSPIRSGWAIATVLSSIGIDREFRLDKLESALLKLNDLGGVVAKASLEPGDKAGTTDVVLNLDRNDQVLGEINLNNHVTEYTGPYQAQASLGLLGLLGKGEIFSLDGAYSGNPDWYGSRRLSANSNVPLTPGGLNWVGSYSWSDYRLLQEFTSDDYLGSFTAGTVGLTQVLWRRPRANLSMRLTGEVNLFDDYVVGIQYSNRTNWIGRLTFNADKEDKLFGGTGLNNAILTFSVGTLSKNADGENALDEATMGAAGTWGKVNLIASRYQMFKKSRWSLELFGQAQGAFKNLDSAEKMSLGWPNAVRAYPPGEAAGDSGLAGQFTARYQIAKNVVLKGFVDGGYIWKWTNWFNEAQGGNSLGLWGPGIGAEWGTRGDLLLSVDLAFPLGENTYRSDGLDSDGNNPDARVWVSLRKWL